MRKAFLTIICFIALLTACTGNKAYDGMMSRADSIMKADADSAKVALKILDGAKADLPEFTRKQRMRYQLLYAKAMNKGYVTFTSDSTMKVVAKYYDRHGTANEKMLSHYILGCVYTDLKDAPKAIECFNEAVEYADTDDVRCDLRELSSIYAQTAALLHAERSPMLEIGYWKKAYRTAYKSKDTITAINYYEHLSGAYYFLGKKDSVMIICRNTEKLYERQGRVDLATDILPMVFAISLKEHRYAEAKHLMDKFEKYSGCFNSHGEIAFGRELYYYYKGLYYQGIEKNDSALFYYYKLLNFPMNISNLQAAYEGLMYAYQKVGKSDSVKKYAVLFADANDSVTLLSSEKEVSRSQALYNYNISQRLAVSKQKEAENYRNIIIVIILGISVVAYFVYRYISKQKKKRTNELQEINEKYSDVLFQYNKAMEDMNSIKKGTTQYRNDKQKEIEELRQVISSYRSDKACPEDWNIGQGLLTSNIAIRLHKLAGRAITPSDAEWNDLRDITSTKIPTFYN
jgi:tetratricopeptide (TPR) repeat protein